jgi:hypothetical protein
MVDRVSTYEAPKGAPEGHDAAMIAKVDATLGEAPEAPEVETPAAKIAGKFDSVEDLEKAYKELEKKLGQPKEKADAPTEDDAEAAVAKAGLDMGDMSEHYFANGELSDGHYEALEKAGIPREYVDAYINGIEAQNQIANDQLLSQVGGQEKYSEITEWAKASLSATDIDKYNRAIDSGDPEVMEQAVMGLSYRYSAENGRSPSLVSGKTSGSGSSTFESVAQVTEAMRDPRYAKDPAYRKEVENRLSRSNIL